MTLKVKYGRGGRRKRHGKQQRLIREYAAVDRKLEAWRRQMEEDYMSTRYILAKSNNPTLRVLGSMADSLLF